MPRKRYLLVDTSVFLRAIAGKKHKGVDLVRLLDEVWGACLCWVFSMKLRDEYVRHLTKMGYNGPVIFYRMSQLMGEKFRAVKVEEDEVRGFLEDHPEFKVVDEDLPHILAAGRVRAGQMLIIDRGVESLRERISELLGIEVRTPAEMESKIPAQRCTDGRFPFPLP